MAEKIERGCSRKEIARTMTAAGLESFQRTKFRVRLDSLSKTRRHRIFLIKICEIISTKEINDPTTATATLCHHSYWHTPPPQLLPLSASSSTTAWSKATMPQSSSPPTPSTPPSTMPTSASPSQARVLPLQSLVISHDFVGGMRWTKQGLRMGPNPATSKVQIPIP